MNTIHHIDEQSAKAWCNATGYSYAFVIAQLKKGLAADAVKVLCSKQYQGSTDPRKALQLRVEAAATTYLEARKYATSPEDKEAARRAYFQAVGTSYTSERVWEQIVDGTWEPRERWVAVGDSGYQVSNRGRFRRIQKSCIPVITPYIKRSPRTTSKGVHGRERLMVKIHGEEVSASRIIAEAFVPRPTPKHDIVLHIDGIYSNLDSTNLKWVTKSEAGKLTGFSPDRARRVVHTADNGIKTVYPSVRAAAKALYLSYQTVHDYCNGKVKQPLANLQFEKPGSVTPDYVEHRAPIIRIGQ